MRILSNTEVKVKSYKIHLMEMVINAIYYNPVCISCNIRSRSELIQFLGSHAPSPRD